MVFTGRNQNGPTRHNIDANLCKTHMNRSAERPKRLIRPIRADAKQGNHEGKQENIDIANPNRFLHFVAKEWCDGVAVASALATSPWHRSLATPQTDDFSHCGSSPESWAQTLRHSGGTSTLVRANSNTVRTARGTGSGNGSHGVFVVA